MASSDHTTDEELSCFDSNYATLLAMGFDGDQSKVALSKNEGDLLLAIDFLTSEMNEKKSTADSLSMSGGDARQLENVGEDDAKPPLPPFQIDELNESKKNKIIGSVQLEIVDDDIAAPKPPEFTEVEGSSQTEEEKATDNNDGGKEDISFNRRKQLSMQKMLEPIAERAEDESGFTHSVENDPSPTCSPNRPQIVSSDSQNTTTPIFIEVEATPVEDQNTIYDAILVPEQSRAESNVDESSENINPPPRWKRYQVLIMMALILIIGVLVGTMISFGISKNGGNNVQNELKLPGVDNSDPMGEGTENHLTNAPTPDIDSDGKPPASFIFSSLEPTSNPTSSLTASASQSPTIEPSQPPYQPFETHTPTSRPSAHPIQPPTPLPSRRPINHPTSHPLPPIEIPNPTSRPSAHPTHPPTPLPSRPPINHPTPFPLTLHTSYPTPLSSRPVHPAVKPILDILRPSRPESLPSGMPTTPTAQETPAPWSLAIPGSPPFIDFPIPKYPSPGAPSDVEQSETPDTPDQPEPPIPCIGENCIIVGRPYYDESGTLIVANPKRTCTGAPQSTRRSEWSIGAFGSTLKTNTNRKSHNHLGLDWSNRALGEHASIASFSAFSIALMTNGAPSFLIEESLKAGLDEIRHAKTSFEIASALLGKEVEPGPLPVSHISFDGNLTKMAFAVAQEGCIDETFSAMAAYLEAAYIEDIIQGSLGNTPYSEVDLATLSWIRDELRIIVEEESKHSSLAWRTLSWVCKIDSQLCEMVWRNVMTKRNLEKAFDTRLGLYFGRNSDMAEIIAEQGWSVVHNSTADDQLEAWVLGLVRLSSHMSIR
ncbi:hypothetical protein ACHAXS_001313 [Conticribra weissflogii]